jgi:ribonuclease VapC
MIIDSSVLVAILLGEPERDAFLRAIHAASARRISAMSKLETGIVMVARKGRSATSEVDLLITKLAATIVPFDEHQADIARDAFAHYGKGRHPAGLNFGDCASYALAIAEAEPLLFKGTDFAATDVTVAQAP